MNQEREWLSGRAFTKAELEDVKYIVHQFSRFSRTELARTICEGLDWLAPNGKYKIHSCLKMMETLEARGDITLPPKRKEKAPRTATHFTESDELTAQAELTGAVSQYAPITLEAVCDRTNIRLWNSFIERYHILGYKRPFGAHQRYFIWSGTEPKHRLGCLLFSASAWALAARDDWIGWREEDRRERLHLIVNNTRFLLFPWIKVKNLASKALSLAARQVPADFRKRYGYVPVLLETFVDPAHYSGTSYRAANWVYVGRTAGRGRMDRYSEYLSSPKQIFLYPLTHNFRAVLCGKGGKTK